MDGHHRNVIIGVALVLGLLFLVPFGALTFTGLTTAPTETQVPDMATPILLGMLVGCIGIVYFVFRSKVK